MAAAKEENSTLLSEAVQQPHHSISQRYRAPALLLFGAASAIFAFFLITAIGIIDYHTHKKNTFLDKPYPSGNGYWPSTVSEMVHNHESPGGKLFYTFGMIAGVCIFCSFYPLNLRNVYTGHETLPGTSIYWTTFRQICPSMGLWLLIGVNTYPTKVALQSRGYTKMFCVFLHLAGAGMMFVGYMVCELKCLRMFSFKKKPEDTTKEKYLAIEGRELKIRRTLAMLICAGFAAFSVLQVALVGGKKLNICCPDDWAVKGEKLLDRDGQNHTIEGKPQIVNTAKGTVFILKILSFVCEDVAGISLVLSHIVIWYFCEERHVDYGKSRLKEVQRQDENGNPIDEHGNRINKVSR